MLDTINRVMAPVRRRVMLMIGRCILTAIDDSRASQVVQVSLMADESRDGLERMAEYGFTSVPLPGAEGVALFVGGDRGHGIVVATADRRYRLTALEGGEVALYDDLGHIVKLSRTGIVIDGGGHDIAISNASDVTVTGCNVTVTGGDVLADGISLKTHVHTGVTTGGSNTGGPI